MSFYEVIGFLVVLLIGLTVTIGPIATKFPRYLAGVLLLGVMIRPIGSLARFVMLQWVYDGGDAGRYYRLGWKIASNIWDFDFSFVNQVYWYSKQFWGTQATIFISGSVLSIIGPTKLGEFLFFSLLAFGGLLLFCKIFQKNYPESNLRAYALWLFAWPSLWFWPSSVGKDALILLSVASVFYGYASKQTGIRWMAFLFGMALAALVRPPVAAILAVSVGLAHWSSPSKRWTKGHIVQGSLILLVITFVLNQSFQTMGVEEVDVEEMKAYIEYNSEKTSQGGSGVGTPGLSPLGVPMAFINIFFRPFLWETASPLWLAASAEMLLFWAIIFIRRQRVMAVAKQWRTTRFLRLAVLFTILYALALGLSVGNLGILARQRIHILPLILIWLEARPVAVRRIESHRVHLPHRAVRLVAGSRA